MLLILVSKLCYPSWSGQLPNYENWNPPKWLPLLHIYTNINIIISDTYFLSKVHKNDFILHLKQFNMIRAFEVRIGTAKLYNFKFS